MLIDYYTIRITIQYITIPDFFGFHQCRRFFPIKEHHLFYIKLWDGKIPIKIALLRNLTTFYQDQKFKTTFAKTISSKKFKFSSSSKFFLKNSCKQLFFMLNICFIEFVTTKWVVILSILFCFQDGIHLGYKKLRQLHQVELLDGTSYTLRSAFLPD